MADFAAFPIPNKVLDPAEYPEFKGETGDTGPAGPQGEIGPQGPQGVPGQDGAATLTPMAAYTETGATLAFVAEAFGDIEIPCDGKVYQLTITGNCSLVTGTVPTAPECSVATVAVLIDTETPPVIALDAAWHWTDSTAVHLPTADESKAVLTLQTYPQGWVEAHVRTIGVPS